ncbi:hypothetical protein OAB11_02415 [Verrucomicrobia bacterium]|nr:hypothetical protein [Verrucomicrobiota bacterium]
MAREAAIHVEQTGACFVAKCEESLHLLEAYAQSKMGESCRILETGGAGGTLRRKEFLQKPVLSLPKGDWT